MVSMFNRHFITVLPDKTIDNAWSDGPYPEKSTENAICINEKGGYQFRLAPDGEENPPIYTFDGIPLYKWTGEKIVPRTEEEIEADRSAIPEPPPSELEQLRADVDFISIMQGVSL